MIKSTCPVAKLCGGCSHIGMFYGESLAKKHLEIERLLKGLCKEIHVIEGAENPVYYRNKVHAACGRNKNGLICGTYAEGSHKIIENPECITENKLASEIIQYIKVLAKSFKTEVYDERTRRGLLRRILIRTADSTGEVLVVLVLANEVFPGKKAFIQKLVQKYPQIKSVVLNINRRTDSMILGDKSIVAFGSGTITDVLCGKKFRISPESFYQINHEQTEKMYNQALELAEIAPSESVLDAYCGTGTIGLIASDKAKSVTGVEINKKAIKDAITNAKMNGITNTRFVCADATQYMVEEASAGKSWDVIILDPPRSGTTPEFIDACKKANPSRIVYISCNPETLARDLKLFAKKGYIAEKAYPYDLFCWTDHIETVCLLSREAH